MVWFEKIESLLISIFRLRTLSHVRIGSGENVKIPSPIDNPQARILRLEPGRIEGKWLPYIPASSIHGVLRSTIETVLRSTLKPSKTVAEVKNELISKNNERDVQQVLNEISRYEDSLPFFEDLPLYAEVCYTTMSFDVCEVPPRKVMYYKTIGRVLGNEFCPCLVCQLFGAPGLRGRVRILNAYPSKTLSENLPLEVITRVAINRVTGAAEELSLIHI